MEIVGAVVEKEVPGEGLVEVVEGWEGVGMWGVADGVGALAEGSRGR